MQITIRQADADDAQQISSLYARTWKQAYVGIVPPDDLRNLREDHWTAPFAAQLSSGESAGLLALADGELAGAAIFCPSRDERKPGAAEIMSFYIDPKYHRNGIGTTLMKAVLSRLKEEGYPEAFLWVVTGNERAMAFYRHCGLRPDGDELRAEFSGRAYIDFRYGITL